MKSFTTRLSEEIAKKKSHLCVGLDISPEGLGNKNAKISDLITYSLKVVDTTIDLAVCYKTNLAFFERWGSDGFKWLEKIRAYIGNNSIIIADGKRGDIGNTVEQYAISVFDYFVSHLSKILKKAFLFYAVLQIHLLQNCKICR
jgi:orotidine-5'-phosphate decarboxylase